VNSRTPCTIPHSDHLRVCRQHIYASSCQSAIATHLAALQAQANASRAAQLKTQKELDALMPAVLDRAFRGELKNLTLPHPCPLPKYISGEGRVILVGYGVERGAVKKRHIVATRRTGDGAAVGVKSC
jgi:hypothetical protein